ncbi:MAG: U32 family peptidase [Proteobacteria bacterium]|nr:U32 family peptidase [Pseudomonadota bacterium]
MNTKTTHKTKLSLALGPVLYYWPRETLLDFYRQVRHWPVDIVYLGEVVCAKRRSLGYDDWLSIAHSLKKSGKKVYISTLTLLEAGSELGLLRRICKNREFLIEANDLAAVYRLSREKVSFVTGPAINIYNAHTLKKLVSLGLQRWVLPLELGATELASIRDAVPTVATEIFAWGRLPLAWSARCYTARAENRSKDECKMACDADPDGRLMYTLDDVPFLVLNGIQIQSALTQNLAPHVADIRRYGVDVLRLSPQSRDMDAVVACFDRIRCSRVPNTDDLATLETLASIGTCEGYWRGKAGFVPPAVVEARL